MGLISRIRSRFGLSLLDTWLLSGAERHSGLPFSFAFSGTPALKQYHADLAFAGPVTELSLGPLPVPAIDLAIRARLPDCAASFVELDHTHGSSARWIHSDLKIPVWMQLEIELKDSLETSLRRSRYKNMRKAISKNSLSCEVKTDDATFDEFYHRMYLPHVQARHGSASVVASYDGLKGRYHHGELLMIKHGEDVVAGSLLDFGHAQPRVMEMGILDGDSRYLRLGVSEAVYWFSFERILQRGGGTANVGNSRPYLHDGALFYKISVGAHFGGHYKKSGFLHLHFRRRTEALERYLASHPVVVEEDGRYVVTGFTDPTNAAHITKEMQGFSGPNVGHQMFLWDSSTPKLDEKDGERPEGWRLRSADQLLGPRS